MANDELRGINKQAGADILMIALPSDVVCAAMLHLKDYVGCLDGGRMNYARMSAEIVRKRLADALSVEEGVAGDIE